MKPIFRNLIYLAATIAIGALSFFLVKMGQRSSSVITSSGSVVVSFTDDYQFLTDEDIVGLITKEYGTLTGRLIDSVNLSKIEAILDSNQVILKSEAYMSKNGDLNVMIAQRRPVVRFQRGSEGLYADAEGYTFKVQPGQGCIVPVVDGILPESGSAWTRSMVGMIQWIQKNKTWADAIVQIHSGDDGDLTLVPRIGKEKFLFGQPDNIESKFARLEDYYKYIVPSQEEGYYSTVNLKYDGQIVCKQ